MPKWFACEVIGTFIMVFLGLGIVAASTTSDATTGIFQIAAVWGLGLACAIFITAHHSGAHFNPAITLAFAFQADFPKRRIPAYFAAQLVGAFIAAAAVFFLSRVRSPSMKNPTILQEGRLKVSLLQECLANTIQSQFTSYGHVCRVLRYNVAGSCNFWFYRKRKQIRTWSNDSCRYRYGLDDTNMRFCSTDTGRFQSC